MRRRNALLETLITPLPTMLTLPPRFAAFVAVRSRSAFDRSGSRAGRGARGLRPAGALGGARLSARPSLRSQLGKISQALLPGEHFRCGGEAKSLEDLANTMDPVVAQRGVSDVATLHARQPLGICVKLREKPRDLRRVEGEPYQRVRPVELRLEHGGPRRLPQHHGTRRRAFVEPGRDLVPTHRELGLVYSAPIGDVVAATPQQVREKEAVLLRIAHPECTLLPIQAARSDCIVIVEETTFARQLEQRGVGHLRPATDVTDVDRPRGEIRVR